MSPGQISYGFRAPFRSRVGLLSAFTLFLSLLIGLSAPTQARAANITLNESKAKFEISIQDFAVCSNFKYDFAELNLGKRGYETCTSQNLSTDNLPASVHVKVRVDVTQSSNNFALSSSDGLDIKLGSQGSYIPVRKIGAVTLTDQNGNSEFSPYSYGVFYAVVELPSSGSILAGDYVLDAAVCDSGCANGQPTTSRFKLGNFSIGPGGVVKPAKPIPAPSDISCVIDSGYLDYVNKSKLGLDTIYNKTAAITDISAPGMAELLKSYSDIVEQESTNVRNTTSKFDAIYKGKGLEKCTGYQIFWDTANSVQTQAASVKSFIDANYVKAKVASGASTANKVQTDYCNDAGNRILAEIKSSYALIAKYNEKLKGPFDLTSASVVDMLSSWSLSLNAESQVLEKHRLSLKSLAVQDPDCGAYASGVTLIDQAMTQYKIAANAIDSWNQKIDKSRIKEENAKEEVLADEDGVEEDPEGTLTVTYSSSLARFILRVESNLPEESLSVRATKRGAKSLRFTINTDEDGVGGLRTRTKLSGYTLTLLYGTTKLDTFRVK